MFSRVSTHLAKTTATTLHGLHKTIHESFTPEPITVDLSNIWDFKSWLEPHIPALQHHSRPHSFRFKKKESGFVEMDYRDWSVSGKKSWKPVIPPVSANDKLNVAVRK